MCVKNTPQNRFLYICTTRKHIAFLRHAAQSVLYFPQNVIYFKILSLYVQTNEKEKCLTLNEHDDDDMFKQHSCF